MGRKKLSSTDNNKVAKHARRRDKNRDVPVDSLSKSGFLVIQNQNAENGTLVAAYRCPYCPEAIFADAATLLQHLEQHKENKEGNTGGTQEKKESQVTNEKISLKGGSERKSLSKGDKPFLVIEPQFHYFPKASRPYSCSKCPATFRKQRPLKEHMKIHNDTDRQWKCSKCNSSFLTSKYLQTHERIRHGAISSQRKKYTSKRMQPEVRSNIAETGGTNDKEIKMEMKEETPPAASTADDTEMPGGDFKCPQPECTGIIFKNGEELIQHFMVHRQAQVCTDMQETENGVNEETTKNSEAPATTKVHFRGAKVKQIRKKKFGRRRRPKARNILYRSPGEKRYNCDKCPFSGSSIKKLSAHVMIHKYPTRPWKCQECPSYFVAIAGLSIHIKNLHPQSLTTNDKSVQAQHNNDNLNANNLSLKELSPQQHSLAENEKIQKLSTLMGEMTESLDDMHDKIKPEFFCPFCENIAYVKATDLIRHLSTYHEEKSEPNIAEAVTDLNENTKHFKGNIKCPPCKVVLTRCDDKNFRDNRPTSVRTTLSKNIPNANVGTSSSDSSSNECPICKKTFAFKQYVRIHLRKHTGEKPYKCSNCPRAFSQPSNLKYHESKYHN